MKAFAYRNAKSADSAVKILGDGNSAQPRRLALALAGGTNLLNLMKDHVLEPDALVNIKDIPGTTSIEKQGDGLRIGANVTLRDILENDAVKSDYPALAQALWQAGSPQIRNVGTLGGNICARPSSCWYFARESFDCLKRGGKTCPALEGENEYHAIFDNKTCAAVHPSSSAPALVVYGAKVSIVGADGARDVAIEDFFSTADILRENVLKSNEIVTHITLGPGNKRSATYEVRHKVANDYPLSLAAVSLTLKAGTCASATICLGGVAPGPLRSKDAEAAIVGKVVSEQTAAAAAEAAVKGATPLSGNAYKVQTTRAAVKRAIVKAAG